MSVILLVVTFLFLICFSIPVAHLSNKLFLKNLEKNSIDNHLMKDVGPLNRYVQLKEIGKSVYELRDIFHVTDLFKIYFEKLDVLIQTDNYQSTFYIPSEHAEYLECKTIIERISFLQKRNCLFSLNVKFLLDNHQIHCVYELNYNHTDKQRIFKLFDYLPSEYSEEIKNLCIEDEDLSQLCELVFVSYIDIMYLRSMYKNDDERYKHKFSVMETYFKKKLDSLKEYYTYKPLTTFDEYNQRRIKMNLLSNIDKLILRLPEEEVEKILRLKSIRLEILNITDGTSKELIDKIQREINFILEMYEKSLEEKVNKDNIETKAFYNYLTYISNDT